MASLDDVNSTLKNVVTNLGQISQELGTTVLPVVPVNLTQVSGTALTLGQKVSATSLPVVIASDQSVLPVSIATALVILPVTVQVATSIMVSASTTSATTTAVQLFAAISTARYYINSLQFSNQATASCVVTLNDLATSRFFLATTSFQPMVFPTPLRTAVGSALTFSLSTGISTVICNAQGWFGP